MRITLTVASLALLAFLLAGCQSSGTPTASSAHQLGDTGIRVSGSVQTGSSASVR